MRWWLAFAGRMGGPGPDGVEMQGALDRPYILGSGLFYREEWKIVGPKGLVVLRLVRRYPNIRWLQRLYATLVGYFWIHCPICGKPFGGHEWDADNALITEREYFSDDPEDELFTRIRRTRSKAVCYECGEEAQNINELWFPKHRTRR